VSFDTKVGNVVTTKTSLVSVANVVKSNPGVFTIGSDGQGDGAILDQGYAVVGINNPAAARKTLSNSDAISIYMTGLGVPDSDVASPTTFWDKDCTDAATYVSSNGISPSLDGQVVLRSLIPGECSSRRASRRLPRLFLASRLETWTLRCYMPDGSRTPLPDFTR
jgi:hypothetical protein